MKILKRIIVRIMVMFGIGILSLTGAIGSNSTAQADPYGPPYECSPEGGECGTPDPPGGGCGCGC